jgi:hypothetical protein
VLAGVSYGRLSFGEAMCGGAVEAAGDDPGGGVRRRGHDPEVHGQHHEQEQGVAGDWPIRDAYSHRSFSRYASLGAVPRTPPQGRTRELEIPGCAAEAGAG